MARARSRAADNPPPRRTPPKSPGGSPVLIIFLVFFVLISITLGVFLYLAQDKIKNAEDNTKKATEDKGKVLNDYVDLQKYYDIITRVWVDAGTVTPQERQDLNALEEKLAARGVDDPRSPQFKSIKEIIEGGASGKGLLGKPDASIASTFFKGKIELLLKQLADMTKNHETSEAAYKKTLGEFNVYQKDWNAERYQKDWKKASDELEAKHKDKIEELNKAIAGYLAQIDSVKKDMEQRLTDEKAKFAAELKLERQRVTDAVAKVEDFRQELKIKFEEKARVVLDENSPRIIRADPNTDIVYIDIGEGDRVSPDLTFNVYKPGAGGKPSLLTDGSIKVISVLGKGVSMARITRISKPLEMRQKKDGSTAGPEDDEYWFTDTRDFWKTRSPIQKGDMLNNPAYRRNSTVHVFLAGIFDLDGDGADDLDTVRRMLREMGADVDGYLDPTNEHEVKGRMDYQTDILVLGDVPVGGSKGAGSKLQENAKKFEIEAKNKGIRVMQLRTFLTEMGYTTVRVPTLRSGGGAIGAPAAKEAAQPKDEAKPKDEEEKKPAKKPVKEEEDKKKDK